MELNLENKFVAFLDVLGFSNLVENERKEVLESYFNTVIKAFSIFDIEKKEIKKLMVSDSIILIAEKSDFRTLIRAIQTLQVSLIKQSIILRGAVSTGPVYFNEQYKLIVGQGYIKAFKLESEAIYPRVIIDPAIIAEIGETKNHFEAMMNSHHEDQLYINDPVPLIHSTRKHDSLSHDGFFVDYADRILLESFYERVSQGDFEMIYLFIKKNLYRSQYTYLKYLWLKNYFIDALKNQYNIYFSKSVLSSQEDITKAKSFYKSWLDKFLNL